MSAKDCTGRIHLKFTVAFAGMRAYVACFAIRVVLFVNYFGKSISYNLSWMNFPACAGGAVNYSLECYCQSVIQRWAIVGVDGVSVCSLT